MTSTTSKSSFRDGVVAGVPFVFIVAPFGMLFGVVAAGAGMSLIQTMAMTIVVIAGASQFTAVQLMTENAPVLITIAAALAVNLRMAMYSASLQPYFQQASLRDRMMIAFGNFDQSFALASLQFENAPNMTTQERVRFFFGAVAIIASTWVTATFVGAAFGAVILPEDLPLDFAMPIMFLAIVSPMLKSAAHLAAAATSIIVALALVGLPSGIGLIFAGLAAMAVGAEVERRGYGP